MQTGKKSLLCIGILLPFALFMIGLYGCGKPELGSIDVAPGDNTVVVGETVSFKAVARSTDGEEMADVTVSWRLEGDAGSIDSAGTFTANKPGQSTIVAEGQGVSGQARVTVDPLSLAKLTLQSEAGEAFPESTLKIVVQGSASEGQPAGYNTVRVETPTDDARVSAETVTLDETGKGSFDLILPPLPGKAVVTASVEEVTAKSEITVKPWPVARIDVKSDSERELAGSTVSIRVKGFSADGKAPVMNRIAVSAQTEGTALSKNELMLDENGAARLEATLSSQTGDNKIVFSSGETTEETVIEGTRVVRTEIVPKKDRFEVGQQIEFETKGYDPYGSAYSVEPKWSLTGDDARLTKGGTVMMESPGNGILFSQYGDIKQAHTFSIVPGQIAEIKISPGKGELKAGDSLTFNAETFNAQGHPLAQSVQWQIDGGVGTIAEDGTFLAKTAGEGSVIAVKGNVRAGVPVAVSHGPLADIIIDLDETTLTAGDKITLSAQGVDAYGNRFSLSPQWFLNASLGRIDQETSAFMPFNAGTGGILAKVGNVVQGVEIEVVPTELARLSVNPSAVDVIAGKTVEFSVTGYDRFDNKVDLAPVYSIQAPLGEIDDTGTFTAKKSGSSIVEARAGGLTGTSAVVVLPEEMVTVELSPEGPMKLIAGQTSQFNATGRDAFGNTIETRVDWAMQPDLGSIDGQGVLMPKRAGKARLTASVRQLRTGKTMKADTEIRVVPGETTRIQVAPASVSVTAGEGKILSATAYDQFGNETDVDINWSLKPPALGSIGQEGRFSAVAAEKGLILARHGNVVGSTSVTVAPAEVAFLKIIPEVITVRAGETVSPKAVMEDRFGNVVKGDALWDLSIEPLAEFTDENALIGKKAGKGELIAAAYNIVETVPLTVEKGPLFSIDLSPGAKTLTSGSTLQFEAAGFDAGGNPVLAEFRWAADDAIGRIDGTGNFTAVKTGTGKVEVHHGDIGVSAHVTVLPGSPAKIDLQPKSFVITAGDFQPMGIEVKDANGNVITEHEASWSVTNDVGAVDDHNRFKASMAREGKIGLTIGTVRAESSVTVETGPIHAVGIAPTDVKLRAGEKRDFSAKGYDSEGNLLDLTPVWSASGGIGSIAQTGAFTATTTGDGYVTVRMKEATAVAKVSVSPGPVDRVAVMPEKLELQAGDEAAFSATAYDALGNTAPTEFSWSLEPAKDAIGNLDEARFHARYSGRGTVVSTAREGVRGRSEVRVVPNDLAEIDLSPRGITLRAGEMTRVKAIGKDAYGNTLNIHPAFNLVPKRLGDIDGTGRLTAREAVTGRLQVTADGISTDVAVTIKTGPLASLEIRLPGEALRAGNSYILEVIGYDAGGNEVPAKADWSVSQNVGSIEKETGLFHARTAGSGLVVAAAAGGIVAHKAVNVEAGKLYSLFIEPNPVTIRSDTTRQFEVKGVDVEENPINVSESAVEWDVMSGIGVFGDPGLMRGTRMGKGKVVVRSGDLLAEAYVTVIPGKPEPKNSRVRVTYPNLPAKDEFYSDIILEVRDRHHNPVPGVQATIVSSRQGDEVIQPEKTNKQGISRGRIRSADPGLSVVRALVNGVPFMDTARITFE